MQKISLLAQSYQELTWRGSVYPPPLPPHPFNVHEKAHPK